MLLRQKNVGTRSTFIVNSLSRNRKKRTWGRRGRLTVIRYALLGDSSFRVLRASQKHYPRYRPVVQCRTEPALFLKPSEVVGVTRGFSISIKSYIKCRAVHENNELIWWQLNIFSLHPSGLFRFWFKRWSKAKERLRRTEEYVTALEREIELVEMQKAAVFASKCGKVRKFRCWLGTTFRTIRQHLAFNSGTAQYKKMHWTIWKYATQYFLV